MPDYRIVKIGKCPVNSSTYDGNIQTAFLKEDFYVVEYRVDKPSIWNLWHPKWRRVTYNIFTKSSLLMGLPMPCWLI